MRVSDLGKRIVCSGCLVEECCIMRCSRYLIVEEMIAAEMADLVLAVDAYRKLVAHHAIVEHEVMDLRADNAKLKGSCCGSK